MDSVKKIVCLSFVVCVLLAGCAAAPEKPEGDQHIYWPKPPVPPRFVYETTLRSDESIRPMSAEDRFRKAMTGEKGQPQIFAKPYGVAAKGGLVVVTDTIQRQGFIFNLARQKVYPLGSAGKEGLLTKPLGVAIGADSQIYVADVTAKKIIVYDAFGMYLQTIGTPGEFDRPTDVAVSPDGKRVYVVDAGGIDSRRHRVVVYSAEGEKLLEFGRRGAGAGEFNLPTQVEVAGDGAVYVLDAGNFRVQVFSADGKFQRAWGRAGRAFGEFARPRGLALDSDDNVYVSDTAFRNVQIFNSKGALLLAIGGERLDDRPGGLAMPADVAVDERRHVYIVDQIYRKVEVLRRLREQEMQAIVAGRNGK